MVQHSRQEESLTKTQRKFKKKNKNKAYSESFAFF